MSLGLYPNLVFFNRFSEYLNGAWTGILSEINSLVAYEAGFIVFCTEIANNGRILRSYCFQRRVKNSVFISIETENTGQKIAKFNNNLTHWLGDKRSHTNTEHAALAYVACRSVSIDTYAQLLVATN